MQQRVSVSEAIVDGRELFLIVESRKTLACGRLKNFSVEIPIAAKVEVPDVVFDLASRANVVVRKKNFTRTQTTFNRFLVTTKHRESDQLAYLRRRGRVDLTETKKPPLRIFELGNCGLHLTVDECLETGGPRAQGFYFGGRSNPGE
jgi:hypothetical protein